MKLLRTIIIPDYIRQVTMSAARQPKYYEKGKKEPKAAKFESARYIWKEYDVIRNKKPTTVYHLFDAATNTKVIANSRVAGTPKIKIINSQEFYAGHLQDYEKGKIVTAIKESYVEYIKDVAPISPEEFPIRILVKLYDKFTDAMIGNQKWDVGNRTWIYGKCFEDVLQDLKIIPDDDRRYITQAPCPLYTPLKEGETRRLEFYLYKDNREEIINSEYYGK
jgi:hypothetical protein